MSLGYDPSVVISQSDLSPDAIMDFVQHNTPLFLHTEEEISVAWDTLAIAELLHALQFDSSANLDRCVVYGIIGAVNYTGIRSDGVFPNAYVEELMGRAVACARCAKSSGQSGWKPLKGSARRPAMRKQRLVRARIQALSARCFTQGLQSWKDLRTLALLDIPYMRCIAAAGGLDERTTWEVEHLLEGLEEKGDFRAFRRQSERKASIIVPSNISDSAPVLAEDVEDIEDF
jgi:hypothetical protein